MELAGTGGVAGTDSDLVAATGTIDLTGAILNISGMGAYSVNQIATYNLFDFTSTTGDFSGVSVGGTSLSLAADVWTGSSGTYSYSFSEGNGVLTVIPEPASILIGSLGLLTLLRRRRS